jgi:lysozyme family protein
VPGSKSTFAAIPTDVAIVALILAHEGSTYTNDPADAGGPTKYGITLRELELWRHADCTAADVQTLTRDEATAIYMSLYIRPFDGLPEPLRVNAIDFGVNAGQRRAIVTVQQIVGADVDGVLGANTKNLAFARDWNPQYVGARLHFYESLIAAKPSQIKFRNGWRNRALAFLADNVLALPRRATVRPAYGLTAKAWGMAA